MSETRHTPGPWTYRYSNDSGPTDDSFWEYYLIEGPNREEVAKTDEEMDAALVAAAPDLLEASLAALSFLLHLSEGARGNAGNGVLAALNAAITKTEGRHG
jgi:hypothetical protein